jgi:hypothetical protein
MTATIVDQARMILGGDTDVLVELRAKHPRLNEAPRRDWFGLRDLDRLERRAAVLAQSRDVWLGGAARRRRGGTVADLAFASTAWTDCDTDESIAALEAFAASPTLVVRTSTLEGEHRQAWWALEERLEPDAVAAANRRIAAALGADAASCDAHTSCDSSGR